MDRKTAQLGGTIFSRNGSDDINSGAGVINGGNGGISGARAFGSRCGIPGGIDSWTASRAAGFFRIAT